TGHGEGKTPWIPVGIGVETGTAYIGAVQMEGGRADITLLGDVVNTTARLCSQAAAGEILIGEQALQMAGLPKAEHQQRKLVLKGKTETVDAWIIKP
ncbi:MAG TPA: adenylate/guanylate cyclase domain-containing protein, partial [Anaerolineales bacterium]